MPGAQRVEEMARAMERWLERELGLGDDESGVDEDR
jgi:hypothetical protein